MLFTKSKKIRKIEGLREDEVEEINQRFDFVDHISKDFHVEILIKHLVV